MWGFIACQECIFSSSEIFWNKCKVAHITPPNHLQVALNRNSVNRVFNCTCVCVCVHAHIYLYLTQSWLGHPASLLSKVSSWNF